MGLRGERRVEPGRVCGSRPARDWSLARAGVWDADCWAWRDSGDAGLRRGLRAARGSRLGPDGLGPRCQRLTGNAATRELWRASGRVLGRWVCGRRGWAERWRVRAGPNEWLAGCCASRRGWETGLRWVAGWEEKKGWAASGFPVLVSDYGNWWAAGPGEMERRRWAGPPGWIWAAWEKGWT